MNDDQAALLYGRDLFGAPIRPTTGGPLAARFEFPPFSVLSARRCSHDPAPVGRHQRLRQAECREVADVHPAGMFLRRVQRGARANQRAAEGGNGMTIRSIRERIEIYSRRRWSEPELREVEIAVMGGALLVAILALLIKWGAKG